jgi:hypothetical protein
MPYFLPVQFCQPQFGRIEEGVNLRDVAGPYPGGREPLISNLIGRQGRFPYSEKRIPDGVEEGVDLFHVIAGPQPGGRENIGTSPQASGQPAVP